MKIVKLNAIGSTNSFLKELVQESCVENFTIVVTNRQTNGRGMQHNNWLSEPHKNLTFSVFMSFDDLNITHNKYLNFAISLAIFEVLSKENIVKLSIKWPNDILSANKKMCGILIENSIKGNKIKSAIVGIGINVNQKSFDTSLKNITSLINETQKEYDLDILLNTLLSKIKEKVTLLSKNKFEELERDYLKVLYRKNHPSMFKSMDGNLFIGIIKGISKYGNLLIELEDESIKEYGIKEVSFI